MGVNNDKPGKWKADVAASVDLYNSWFIEYAPKTFRDKRRQTLPRVEAAFTTTKNLRDIDASALKNAPSLVQILRMCTAPPIARDRLIGLSGVERGIVQSMENKNTVPQKKKKDTSGLTAELNKIAATFAQLLDQDLFPWLPGNRTPKADELRRALVIVADRLCGAEADPMIRNAQETRQLNEIERWLTKRGYSHAAKGTTWKTMKPGTFAFRMNVPVQQKNAKKQVNIPLDAVVMPKKAKAGTLPLLFEAKSAGDPRTRTSAERRRRRRWCN